MRVKSIDRPLNTLPFRRFQHFFKGPWPFKRQKTFLSAWLHIDSCVNRRQNSIPLCIFPPWTRKREMFTRYLDFKTFWWAHSKGLKLADDIFPLSSWQRENTLFEFIDTGRCSPVIVFIILKISNVFSPISIKRLQSSSKIAQTLFSVLRIFYCKMCLADLQDWLYYHLPPLPPPSRALY